jgi:hypothetical protein
MMDRLKCLSVPASAHATAKPIHEHPLLVAPLALAAVMWTATGSLNTPRVVHTATWLPGGMVLVAGGLSVSGGLLVALREPCVELQLEVELVGKAPAGLEAALEEVLQPLDNALGLRVARLAKEPVDAQRAAERGELRRRPPAAGVKPGLLIPDQRLRQRSERPQAAADPEQQVRDRLDQRAGARVRLVKTRDDDIALAGLALADRDLIAGLPQVELADLPGPVDRALKGARRTQQRPHLAQVVIDDGLAASKAKRCDQLPDPLTGNRRSFPSSRWISSLNGSSFDPPARADKPAARRCGSPC